MAGLVKEGMGVTFFFADLAQKLKSVAVIPLAEHLEIEAGVAWNRNRYLKKAASKLIELLSLNK